MIWLNIYQLLCLSVQATLTNTCGPFPGSGYHCISLTQALTSRAGHKIQAYKHFQSMKCMQNDNILYFVIHFHNFSGHIQHNLREEVKISPYKPHTNHRRSSVRSHTLAPTTICDLSHSLCWSPLTDLGHISSVTYVCHPLWFVCGDRKGNLTSPLILNANTKTFQISLYPHFINPN